MSHYIVAVIHDEKENIEDVLAPYVEEVSEGDEYAEFEIEVKKGKEKEYQDSELKSDYWHKPEKKEDLKKYSDMSPEEFVKEYGDYDKNDNGDYGYWCNPNAKWDWFVVGGRWRNSLKLLKGKREIVPARNGINKDIPIEGWCDSAKIGDVDWKGMEKDNAKKYSDLWKEAYKRLANEAIKKSELVWQYGIRDGETKENYVERNSKFTFFSLLMDGEWQEVGAMGWFGADSASKDDKKNWEKQSDEIMKVLKKGRSEDVITMVDCHI